MVISSTHLRCGAAAAVGLAFTTAHPAGVAAAISMPALALSQPTRRASFQAALFYYGAALWPMMPGANNFFGPDASVLAAVFLWVSTTAALSSAWPLVWSRDRWQAIWRSPAALLLTVLPPLGIIGFASPLTAAGFLFPRTAWCGLLACAVLSGTLAAWPYRSGIVIGCLAAVANAVHLHDPESLPGWQGVSTTFGAIAHRVVNPVTTYEAAQWIQQFSLSSNARVIVFPETVVPSWTAATEAFWQQTLERLRTSGKTIVVGALVPDRIHRQASVSYDFSADLVALRGDRASPIMQPAGRPRPESPGFSYDNVVIVRGAITANFAQRIPVPIGMWNPFGSGRPRLNLFGPSVLRIAGERAAVLVCYEQLVPWPVLTAMLQRPTVLVGVANDHWASGTPIPASQVIAMRAWSRLFGIPITTAINQ